MSLRNRSGDYSLKNLNSSFKLVYLYVLGGGVRVSYVPRAEDQTREVRRRQLAGVCPVGGATNDGWAAEDVLDDASHRLDDRIVFFEVHR